MNRQAYKQPGGGYDYEKLYHDLKERGYVAQPIPAPTPHCKTCDDAGSVTRNVPVGHPDFGRAFPCPACRAPLLAQERVEKLLRDVPRLARYENMTLESFISKCRGDLTGKEYAIQAMHMMARGEHPVDEDGYTYNGVIYAGPYGVGKTGLAALSLFERLRVGIAASCIDWQRYADGIQDTYTANKRDQGDDAPTRLELLKAAIGIDFLVIDELGHYDQASKVEVESPDRRRILEALIAGRHARPEALTVITTNLSVTHLRAAFGEYVVQRLLELCALVEIDGVPIRNLQGRG